MLFIQLTSIQHSASALLDWLHRSARDAKIKSLAMEHKMQVKASNVMQKVAALPVIHALETSHRMEFAY